MSNLENKSLEQKKAVNNWIKNNCLGTINAASGFGNCKVGLDCINYIYNLLESQIKEDKSKFKILIVTPTTEIKNEWFKEFKKWKLSNLLEFVDIQCVNTCCKYRNRKYSLGIFDEVHNYLGNSFYNVFKNNLFKRKLCLSASIKQEFYYQLIVEQKCPVVYQLNIDKALNLNLINTFKVYNLGVELTAKEKNQYNYLTNKIEFNKKQGYNSWDLIGQRKNIVYNAHNKYEILKVLKQYFNSYGIIFSQSKNSAEKVNKIIENSLVHHSGLSKKERDNVIKLFSDGRTKEKILSTAMTLDEGVSLPRLNFAIILSGTSKERQFVQRTGRVVRLEKNKKESIIIRLYCKNTIEENWLRESQKKVKNLFISKEKISDIWN